MKLIKDLLKTILVVFTSLLLVTSCEVGLGEAVDLEAPSINIETPAPTAIVQKDLQIKGTVSDNVGVTEMTVSLSAENFSTIEYRWSNGWTVFENGIWKEYKGATCEGKPTNLFWTINVDIPENFEKKDFILTTIAKDEFGNQSKNSKDERLITVDGVEPSAEVTIEKALFKKYSDAESVYSSCTLRDNSILDKLVNGNFAVKINQKENARLGQFKIIFDTVTDSSIPSVAEQGDLFAMPNVYQALIPSSTRSFEINVERSQLKNEIQNGKHLLRVVTESFDEAGNIERKVQGFFIYYHEADAPWTQMSLGDNVFDDSKNQKEVYPSCMLQGNAYDDDGLKSVDIELWIYKNFVWMRDESRTQHIDLEADDYPKNNVWTIYAISDSNHFKVVSKCTDINGAVSIPLEKFFRISDVNPPQMEITEPKSGDVVLGNSNGKFTLKGQVKDDGPVKSLKMVRIANKNKGSDNFLKYFSGSYQGWTSELDGNKVFEINLIGSGVPEGGYCTYEINQEFNLFGTESNSFGINGTGTNVKEIEAGEGKKDVIVETVYSTENLKNQTLLFRVEDTSGSVAVETFSFQGDVEPPVLTIDNINVVSQESGYDKSKAESYPLNSDNAIKTYKRNESNIITDKIYFTGTWSDNAAAHWGDNSKIGEIYLYNSYGLMAPVVKNSNGTWESYLITPEDTTTSSVQALITDWGGNTTKASGSYFVSSSKPVLLRVNSSKQDGTYKDGDEIMIVMEYNKKVTFEGGSSAPELILNNNGKATYSSGNGESKHYYYYKVGSGSETSLSGKLKVSSLNTNGNTWKDNNKEEVKVLTISDGINLDKIRSIYIDNNSPRIVKISPVTGGYFNKDKEIWVQADFNKEITVKDFSKTKLVLNISGTGKTETSLDAFSQPSSKSVLFKYKILENDNTLDTENKMCKLRYTQFIPGENNIVDIAGNAVTDVTPTDTTDYFNSNAVYVDTKKPLKPSVTGVEDFDSKHKIYYTSVNSIRFDNFEPASDATRYYSLDGGNSWINYLSNPVISQNGTYKVCAKQIDKAGNESDMSDVVTVKIDAGNLYTSISAEQPDGTYKNGNDNIVVVLSFRNKISAQNVKLKLNITDKDRNAKTVYANLISQTDDKKLRFSYEISESDFCFDALNVMEIDYGSNGWIKDEYGNVVAGKDASTGSSVTGNVEYSSNPGLVKSRTIKIVNGKPVVESITLTKPSGAVNVKQRQLRIKFNSEITKQSGNSLYITLKQETGFEAPAMLSKTQWEQWPSDITKFYKETTNGWNANTGSPDLASKYVLKYEFDTDNTELVGRIKALDDADAVSITADRVVVDMGSNYIYVDENDRTVLVVELKDDFILPVQGADYTVTIPAGVVENYIKNKNEEVFENASTKYIRSNPGVETPVIRINKVSETISGTSVTQNPTTTFKIDCQTPLGTDDKIYYKITTQEDTYIKLINNGGNDVTMAWEGSTSKKITAAPKFTNSIPSKSDMQNTSLSSLAKKATGSLGSAINGSDMTKNKGYMALISATAKKGSSYSDEIGMEFAMRTIIFLKEMEQSSWGGAATGKVKNRCTPPDGDEWENCKANRWLRGGDNISGGVSTADFPLTWNGDDWNENPRTVRAMTPYNNTDGLWYWISWNVSTTAYVHFVAGNIPSDADTNGPDHWWWSCCGWVGKKEQTPVYAGECTVFQTDASTNNNGYSFLNEGKHKVKR